MQSAFLILDLPHSLTLTPSDIQRQFQQSKKEAEEIQARDALLSPTLKLQNWMQFHSIPRSKRIPIPEDLILLFMEISEVLSKLATVTKAKEASLSSLKEALLQRDSVALSPPLTKLHKAINELIKKETDLFPELQRHPSVEKANEILQRLQFLTKWHNQINHAFSSLLF